MTRYIGNPEFAGAAYLSDDESKVILIKLMPIKLFLEYYKENKVIQIKIAIHKLYFSVSIGIE
jgi:hypothetical protein